MTHLQPELFEKIYTTNGIRNNKINKKVDDSNDIQWELKKGYMENSEMQQS